jgi:hypothetical protein
MFSSRKLQTNIPSVPSQAYEPADDTDKEDEYVMAGDNRIDAVLGPGTLAVKHTKQKLRVLLRKTHLQAQG